MVCMSICHVCMYVCMYVYIYICMYVYIYIYICVHMCTYMHMYMYMYMYICSIFICLCLCICMHIYIYTYIYIYMYACMHIYIYMYSVAIIIGVCVCVRIHSYIDMVSLGWSISPSLQCFPCRSESLEARRATLFWWKGLENRVPKKSNGKDLYLISNRHPISNYAISFHHKEQTTSYIPFPGKAVEVGEVFGNFPAPRLGRWTYNMRICHSQDCNFSASKTPDCSLFL